MPSYLTFAATEQYRSVLMARNLSPYTVPGVYSPNVGNLTYETVLRDEGVYDSPDSLIADDPFADLLYPLNAYGPLGGYNKEINAGGLANTKSNLGVYDVTDTRLPLLSFPIESQIPTQNKYSFDSINLESTEYVQLTPQFSFYANPGPISFVPSQYTPYQILLNDNPFGSDGSLSQDSSLAQLGARSLRDDFRNRIAREIEQNTLGRINLPNVYNDPILAVQILQGKVPLVERDWVITRPDNVLVNAADLLTRLSGAYFPGSLIPGEYFTLDSHSLNLYSQVANSFEGENRSLVGRLLFRQNLDPSQLFLNNTGGGQKSQMYFTLGFNKYGPEYDRSILGEFIEKGKNALASLFDIPIKGGYYVGSKQNDPSRAESPSGKMPLNSQGGEIESIVYGPDVLAKLYEPTIDNVKFGLLGDSFYDNGGISGGLTWSTVSSDLKAGYKVGKGGDQIARDEEYNQTTSYIKLSTSADQDFRDGSILYQTQKLVEAGQNDLKHVGNAINQISKVFNDGYKEITKGSRVMSYVNENGAEVGKEYCRIFTKDTPYMTYGDLQKTDGNIRKFSYSVLDNTYNLNIAPLKSTSSSTSTNIKDGQVQKYMFSLENLAWRTSNRNGFRVSDLPDCEKGPNWGRIMWFPPYDLKFNESTTIGFDGNSFLGRPEPVFTYKNTTRTGSLSWTILVDHPSILNVIVNKELNGKRKEEINGIVDSFFAGCKKYDIYELARKYNMLSINELFDLQQIINNPNATEEVVTQVLEEIVVDTPIPPSSQTVTNAVLNSFINFSFFFDNDEPPRLPNDEILSDLDYRTLYNNYVSQNNILLYKNQSGSNSNQVENFFNDAVIYNFDQISELQNTLVTFFVENPDSSIVISLQSSTSSRASIRYNQALSLRRIDSIKKFFESNPDLSGYISNNQLQILYGPAYGEEATSSYVNAANQKYGPYNCTDNDRNNTDYNNIYSTNAMACRRVWIDKIEINRSTTNQLPTNGANPTNNPGTNKITISKDVKQNVPVPPTIGIKQSIKDGISKKILRKLLNECDYFSLIEESNPMFKDNIKEKIKYFDPVFHSITPEGLNSRLTFLQQCSRPGDTIPIIGLDGKPKYNNATNTAFGAPPVLVLRVGDFFYTKIIPTSIQVSYENLDINPEGIGVQPMLAKVTLGFNFIGGSGLKGPIDRLQNALSFNYYANTEMYDERADATDESYKKIDSDLVDAIINSTPIVGVNNLDDPLLNNGGATIGIIETSTQTQQGLNGTINYKNIMDSLLENGQLYMNTYVNKASQIVDEYNYPILTAFIQNRNYVNGYTNEFVFPKELKIFGKPNNIDSHLNSIVNAVYNDIEIIKSKKSEENGLFYIKTLYDKNFDKNVIKQIKQNLKKIISDTSPTISTGLNSCNNDICSSEIKLINTLSKIDFVITNSDGLIRKDQQIKIYNISGTTTNSVNSNSELVSDYTKASDDLYTYYNDLITYNLLDVTFNVDSLTMSPNYDDIEVFKNENNIFNFASYWAAESRFYAIMSKTILNDNSFETFITNLVPKDIMNSPSGDNGKKLVEVTRTYFLEIKRYYNIIHQKQKDIVKKFIDSQNYKDVYGKNWLPYPTNKSRIFTFNDYIPGTDVQKTRLQNLYKNGNSNTSVSTFNGKTKLN